MSKPLTEEFFTTFMASFQKGLFEVFVTKDEFKKELQDLEDKILRSVGALRSAVDGYLKRTEPGTMSS